MVFKRMTVPIHGIAFIMNLLMYPLITQSLSDIGPAIRKLALQRLSDPAFLSITQSFSWSIDGVEGANLELISLFFAYLLPRSGGESHVQLTSLAHDWLHMKSSVLQSAALADLHH